MKTIKKITFIGPVPPPLGGVAVVNISFQKLKYDNATVTFFNTSNQQERENLYSRFSLKNSWLELKKAVALKKFITRHQPDLIHIFITSGYAIVRDILFLKIISTYKIPVVIHFHSKTAGEFALKPALLKIIGRLFNTYAAKIVLLSETHLLFFKKYFPAHKCLIIENFVDYSNYNCEIAQKSNSFLYVGRLTKEKGFYDLLDALLIAKKEIKDIKVNVIGLADTDENERKISAFIIANDLSENIILHGAKFDSEKYKLFKNCFCLIFPSHFENSPVVLKEAIAAKMALIASDIKANTAILKKSGNYLLFETKNFKQLAAQIISLYHNQIMAGELMHASSKILEYDSAFAIKKMNQLTTELC